jgi:plastocyanin
MKRHDWTIRARLLIGALALAIGVAAAAAAERQHIVLVKKWNVVDPGDLTVGRGDEVLWLNTSGQPFTLIFDRVPGAPDVPLVIFTDFTARFDRPGTYRYLITGMGVPRGGASLRHPAGRPAAAPAAATSEVGWITVK